MINQQIVGISQPFGNPQQYIPGLDYRAFVPSNNSNILHSSSSNLINTSSQNDIISCCYFLRGQCGYGNSCRYQHTNLYTRCSFGERCWYKHTPLHPPPSHPPLSPSHQQLTQLSQSNLSPITPIYQPVPKIMQNELTSFRLNPNREMFQPNSFIEQQIQQQQQQHQELYPFQSPISGINRPTSASPDLYKQQQHVTSSPLVNQFQSHRSQSATPEATNPNTLSTAYIHQQGRLSQTNIAFHFPQKSKCFKFDADSGEWKEFGQDTIDVQVDNMTEMKVSTYNVLFDTYDADRLYTEYRVPVILDLLKETNSDFIGLQEVKTNFISKLIEQDWVKKNYYVSSIGGPDDPVLSPYGQVLLSRYPFELRVFRLAMKKSLIVGDFNINDVPLSIAVVHLSAGGGEVDHVAIGAPAQKSKSLLRMKQLDVLFEQQQDLPLDTFLIGDMNFGDEGPENEYLKINDYIDVWPELHPDTKGYTYDRDINTLARDGFSYSDYARDKSYRLDRVFYRPGSIWTPNAISLFGDQPFDLRKTTDESDGCDDKGEVNAQIFPSDHFGVTCVFSLNEDAI